MKKQIYRWAFLLLTLGSVSCTDERSIHTSGNLVHRTVDEDSALPAISANGALLHAEAFGDPDDPLLVILHGGPGADYRYLLNCREFANEGYRVVFFDQRGAGLSQRFPYSIYTLQLQFDDLNAVIQHYQTSPSQKIFLLGHSWGAMLATAFINEYPDRVAGAILGEPGGFTWADITAYLQRSKDFRLLSEDLNDALYLDQFLTGTQNDHAVLDYKLDLLAAADGSKDNPTGNEGTLPHWRSGAVTFHAYLDWGQRVQPDWTTNLQQFTTPVLFLYSEHNRAYGLDHARRVSSAYPNVRLFETLGAGHDMLSFPTGWRNTYPTMLSYLHALR